MGYLRTYIIRQVLPPTVLCLTLFSFVGLISQLTRMAYQLETFYLDPFTILPLLPLLIPPLFAQTIPAAFLCGLGIAISRMSQEIELLALNCAGISRWTLSLNLLPLALAATAATALSTHIGAPWALNLLNQQVDQIQDRRVLSQLQPGHSLPFFKYGSTFTVPLSIPQLLLSRTSLPRRQHLILHADLITAPVLTKDHRLKLFLQHGTILQTTDAKPSGQVSFDRSTLALPMPAQRQSTHWSTLNTSQLIDRIQRLSVRGKPTAVEQFGLYKRTAFPASCIVFAGLAFQLAAPGRPGSRARTYLLTVAILLSYYFFVRITDAYASSVDPLAQTNNHLLLATWLPNLTLGALALVPQWRHWRA